MTCCTGDGASHVKSMGQRLLQLPSRPLAEAGNRRNELTYGERLTQAGQDPSAKIAFAERLIGHSSSRRVANRMPFRWFRKVGFQVDLIIAGLVRRRTAHSSSGLHAALAGVTSWQRVYSR
jgi:hypothetical protein